MNEIDEKKVYSDENNSEFSYNENKSESIYPTPVISMVGLIENINYLEL